MSDFLDCDHGVYRIYWKSGGSSVASVGSDYNGDRWVAPSNWTCPKGQNPTGMLKKIVKDIEKMELIDVQHQDD